ncbi:MAG TPA: choice-of-anchor tandem repeat GloVer-containing protein [Terriglobia bacterium]
MNRTMSVFLRNFLLVLCLIPFAGLRAQAQEVPVQRAGTVIDPALQEREGPLAGTTEVLSEKVLYSFAGEPDGASPVAPLVRDSSGNLYGTTYYGGASNLGAVFKLDTTGTETVLYSFPGGVDGERPSAGLVRDAAGNLYGTTDSGGNTACANGCGVVYELSATGTYSVLHSFAGYPTDGALPRGLIRDSQGNLYGGTYQGGDVTGNCGKLGCGVIFELNKAGTETILYNLQGYPVDGSGPEGVLTTDASGNFYGLASSGGTVCKTCGAVYELDTAGKETVLYSFSGKSDGSVPHGGLVLDSSDNLYGTTYSGGSFSGSLCSTSGCGVVFEVTPSGTETVLYTFTGGADGANPRAYVLRDPSGNLYGTTFNGGSFSGSQCSTSGCGVVFRVAPAGKEIVLHTFAGSDGANPRAGLVGNPLGNVYGTTEHGGADSKGTVFEVILKPAE